MGFLSWSVRTDRRDVVGSIRTGVKKRMRKSADVGFRESLRHVPTGATSGLRLSAVEPGFARGGRFIVWGYTAPYAPAVEEGTEPHYIPTREMPGLKKWARRVLGDPKAAGPVRDKIAEEGTDAQPFVEPGAVAQKRWLRNNGLLGGVQDELGSGP